MASSTGSTHEQSLQPPPVSHGRGGGLIWGVMLLLVCGLGVWALAASIPGLTTETEQDKMQTYRVSKGDLLVTVTEDGNVESGNPIELKCRVKGGSEILTIVPDGTKILPKGETGEPGSINVGDVLVELDRSKIDDAQDTQEIVVSKARSAVIQAEKDLQVAEISVREYEQGTYVQELQLLEAEITIAMENLRGNENQFEHTQKMYRKGFVTQLQLEADEFAVKRAKLELQASNTKKKVLVDFTREKMVADLSSKVKTATAKVESENKSLQLEEKKFNRLKQQTKHCIILADSPGMAVYANERSRYGRGGGVQIEEGSPVRELQTIIRIPDLTTMQVKVLVHESKVKQIREGDRAQLKLHGREEPLHGVVTKIANQPEPTSWYQAKVQEYATTVEIDGDPQDLVPGMSAEVLIEVEERPNVLKLPVEAVVEQAGAYYCWVYADNKVDRKVLVMARSKKGDNRVLTDNKFVGIESGIEVGNEVVLNPRGTVAEARKIAEKAKEEAETIKRKKKKAGPADGSGAGYQKKSGAGKDRGGPGKGKGKGGGRPGAKGKAGGGQGPDIATIINSFWPRMDTNGDNLLDEAEINATRDPDQTRKADSDGDGKVSKAEFTTALKKRMESSGSGKGAGGRGGR